MAHLVVFVFILEKDFECVIYSFLVSSDQFESSGSDTFRTFGSVAHYKNGFAERRSFLLYSTAVCEYHIASCQKVMEVKQEAASAPAQECVASESPDFGIRTVENTERQRLYEGLLVRTQEEQKKRKSKKPVVDENQLSLFGFVA